MKNHNTAGGLGSKPNGGSMPSNRKIGLASALDDSDDHDDFNPINDLMPPTLQGEDMDLIGKKRPRDKDPLRQLVDETAVDNLNQAISPNKRNRPAN